MASIGGGIVELFLLTTNHFAKDAKMSGSQHCVVIQCDGGESRHTKAPLRT